MLYLFNSDKQFAFLFLLNVLLVLSANIVKRLALKNKDKIYIRFLNKNSMLGLVIVDPQEKFLKKMEKGEKAKLIENIKIAVNYAVEKGIPIITLKYKWFGGRIERTLLPHLKRAKSFIIPKTSNNAFLESPFEWEDYQEGRKPDPYCSENRKLKRILKEKNIDSLVLAGVNRDVCVYGTAIGAKRRNYKIVTCNDLMNQGLESLGWYEQHSTIHYDTMEKFLANLPNQNL